MRFKVIRDKESFIHEIAEEATLQELYAEIAQKIGEKVFIFKNTPRILIPESEQPIKDALINLECLYLALTPEVKGPVLLEVNDLADSGLCFSIFEVPGDNSCLFHALSELLDAKSSGELRKIVADTILRDPERFRPYIEKDPFTYSKWITRPESWGGEPEITIVAQLYQTKVCVIHRDLRCIEFEEGFRSVVYLMYTGSHYNAVVGKDKLGRAHKKFPRGDKSTLEKAKAAVDRFFRSQAPNARQAA